MQINHALPCLHDKFVAILVRFYLLPSFLITNRRPLYLLSLPEGFFSHETSGKTWFIRTSVQSLPICGYSFSKKNLDVKLPACPAQAKAGIQMNADTAMTHLTRHQPHVYRAVLPFVSARTMSVYP